MKIKACALPASKARTPYNEVIVRNFEEAVGNGTVPDAQNGFIIKQTVDRITVYNKYMQIKFKLRFCALRK